MAIVKPSLKKAIKEALGGLPPSVRKAFTEFGRTGGKTRARRMTAEQRSEAARKAVQARWAKERAKAKKGAS